MIPNSAPLAAVFLRLDKPVTFSLPVVGWSADLNPLVPHGKGLVDLGDSALPNTEFVGIWPGGWAPNIDQRRSLLPKEGPAPGGQTAPLRCRYCSDQLNGSLVSTQTESSFCGANPDADVHVPQR